MEDKMKKWLGAFGASLLVYVVAGAVILNTDLSKLGGYGIGEIQDVNAAEVWLGLCAFFLTDCKRWGICMIVLGLLLFGLNDPSFMSIVNSFGK